MGKGKSRDLFLMVAVSFVLYLIPLGNIIFIFPLLLLSKRYPKRTADTACVAVLVLVFLRNVYLYKDMLSESLTWAFIAVSLYFPISLILSAGVWVNTGRGDTVRRICLSAVPSLVLFVLFGIWASCFPETASTVYTAFESSYTSLLTEVLPSDAEMLTALVPVILLMFISLAVPAVMLNLCVVAFLFEAASHNFSSEFDTEVSHFRLDGWFIYLFLAMWALILVKNFVDFPTFLALLVNNLTFAVTLLYTMQGAAIIYFQARKKNISWRCTRFFALFFVILMLLPGVNMLAMIILPLLGVCETWLALRKEDQGVFNYENHS